MKKYVCGFMFSENRENVALIMKNKPQWQKDHLNGVGGKIEGTDEEKHPERAMCREFKEETGVHTEPKDWDHYVTLNGEGYTCNFLRAFSNEVYKCDTQEEEEVIILECDKLDMWEHIPNLRWLIPLALDKTIRHVTVEDTGN